jgi:hypothetical protein
MVCYGNCYSKNSWHKFAVAKCVSLLFLKELLVSVYEGIMGTIEWGWKKGFFF